MLCCSWWIRRKKYLAKSLSRSAFCINFMQFMDQIMLINSSLIIAYKNSVTTSYFLLTIFTLFTQPNTLTLISNYISIYYFITQTNTNNIYSLLKIRYTHTLLLGYIDPFKKTHAIILKITRIPFRSMTYCSKRLTLKDTTITH